MKRWGFKDDLIDVNVFADLTLQGRLFLTDGAAYEKRPVAKRVYAHRGKTKNGSIECMHTGGRQRMEVSSVCTQREDKEWKYRVYAHRGKTKNGSIGRA